MSRVNGPSRQELDSRGNELAARVRRAINSTLRDVGTDELDRIRTVWRDIALRSLVPRLYIAWDTAVAGVRGQLEHLTSRERVAAAADVFEIPKVTNALAELFLADAENRLVGIGDHVWEVARAELLEGMQLGEGAAELRERVIASANVSARRAETIARTEVNSAMNNGAYQQMKTLDMPTIKEWIATDDSRTRESHEEVDGAEIAGDAKFTVGGFPMDHPHDVNAPPGETINCRCTIAWEVDFDALDELEDEEDEEDEELDDELLDEDDDVLLAAGDFDESKHKRDGKGRFAKKPGGGDGGAKGKKLKITHGLVHKQHAPGTIIAINGGGSKRAVWDGNKYLMQEKQADGGWVTVSTTIKSKAYVELGKFDDDWHEPGDDASAPDIELNTPKPATTKSSATKSAGEAGSPLKITHGFVHKKHEPGDILTENGAGDKRVVWDGDAYRLQSKTADGKWTTEKTAIKSKAYKEINDFDSDWRVPGSPDITSDSDVSDDTVAPSASVVPSPSPNSGSTKKPKSKIYINSILVKKKNHSPGTIIAVNLDENKRVVWDGDKYLLQQKADDDSWLTVQHAAKTDSGQSKIKEFDNDWYSPREGEETADVTSAPAAAPAPAPAPSSSTVPINSMDDLTFTVKTKKGALFNDANGQTWQVAAQQSESHARNQFLAATLYTFAGASTEHTELVSIDPAKMDSKSPIGIKTPSVLDNKSLIDAMKTDKNVQQNVRENFAIDAWLGNWDVVGLGYENLAVSKYGEVKRTNVGGSLLYRANGTPKGNAFGDKVTEIDSLRNPTINPSSAKIFADVTEDDIRKGVKKLEQLSPNVIDYVVEQSGFTGAEATKLKNTLKARRQDLIDKYGTNAPKLENPFTPSAPAPSTQPTASNALGTGVPKTYTAVQKAKVQSIFNKHNLKWHNKTDQLYDAALEVSKTHPDLTMGDALDIMDQSLKKKTGNPFRTKVEKWLKTKAGKQHALAQGGSASIGGTSSVTPAGSTPAAPPKTSAQYGQYHKINRPAANLMQKQMDEAFPPPWTSEQRNALRVYTGGSYTTINKCARGTAPCDPHTKALVENIKAGMKPSTQDIMVFRKTNPASFGLKEPSEMESLVGKVINDDGVISTSIRSDMWNGKLHLEIEAPKGSMMAWVQPISQHPGEDEIVVAPGTHYEVVSVTKNPYGTNYVVRLRIVPGSDTRSKELKALTSA